MLKLLQMLTDLELLDARTGGVRRPLPPLIVFDWRA
jgi:hypothetical protein